MSKVADKLIKVLREKKTVITMAFFWRISHNSGGDDVRLKVGRYKKPQNFRDKGETECLEPKSELTFGNEEFEELIKFLQENYEPFKKGFKAFIPVDKPFTHENAEQVRKLFSVPDKTKLIRFIAEENIIPTDIASALDQLRRAKAVREFESMLAGDLREQKWQKWFQDNSWVLGSEFVRVLDERHIDPQNISDFLMQAYDGFLDVIEIKRPEGDLQFWAATLDHGNYISSLDLTKAIAQALRYIYEVEREANSVKFLERVNNVKTIKPRGVLIFGRSNDWNEKQQEAYRILNSGFHSLTVMTYDQVLDRAKRMVGSA